MLPFLIGESPSRRWGNFAGPSFDRLARAAGLGSAVNLPSSFLCVNLLVEPQPVSGKVFPMRRARSFAQRLRPFAAHAPCVLLGRRVATAFGLPDSAPYLRRIDVGWPGGALDVAIVPAGDDRRWNDPAEVAAISRFLRGVLAGEETFEKLMMTMRGMR